MLPAKAIVEASARWLELLQTSTVNQAAAMLRTDAVYLDLTMTQYSSGLELLKALRFLEEAPNGAGILSPELRGLLPSQTGRIMFERLLEDAPPAWLLDADVLVTDPEELPGDALEIAEALKLDEPAAFSVIQNIHGHIDFEQRRVVGLAGEQALLQLLEKRWPGSATHVAAISDGFGYDILFRHEDKEWHLEVKTTGRQGRLRMFLSRHEYEVSLRDSQWKLIIAGLDAEQRLRAVATVKENVFRDRCPVDSSKDGRWQSASHDLTDADLLRGLAFVKEADLWEASASGNQDEHLRLVANRFTWLPETYLA